MHTVGPGSESHVEAVVDQNPRSRAGDGLHCTRDDAVQAAGVMCCLSDLNQVHTSTGRFDFVLANPPFNVNAVDKERLEGDVGKGRRFPFGLPSADNANYLWIQLFYSALNDKGRAGFPCLASRCS